MDFTKMLAVADETTEKPEKKEAEVEAIDHRRASKLSIANSTMSETIEMFQDNALNEEETGGNSGVSPFKEYVKAIRNTCLLVILVIILIISQTTCTAADYWVAFWTQQEEIRYSNSSIILRNDNRQPLIERIETYDVSNSNPNPSYYTYTREITDTQPRSFSFNDLFDRVQVNDTIYNLLKTEVALYFYGALIVTAIIVTLARSLLFFNLAMRASKNLHSKMFHVLLQAPMRFFDTNPSGRVLNRFSKDMGAIDEILPRTLWDAIQVTASSFGIGLNV